METERFGLGYSIVFPHVKQSIEDFFFSLFMILQGCVTQSLYGSQSHELKKKKEDKACKNLAVQSIRDSYKTR